MKIRRTFSTLLACVVLIRCLAAYAGAVEQKEYLLSISINRATNRFSIDIPQNTLAKTSSKYSLVAGDTITINASYSPDSASVDFGYLDPDGRFHFVNVTGGGVNYTFEVEERGSYTLAIRNNSSQTVSVSGTINY